MKTGRGIPLPAAVQKQPTYHQISHPQPSELIMNDQVLLTPNVYRISALGELRDLSAFDIPTEIEHLNTQSGLQMHSKFGRAVVRKDINQVIGRIGPRTRHEPLINNQKRAVQYIEESGLDLTGCVVTDTVFDNGARARRQVEFPRYVVEPQVGDITRFMLDIYDSQNNSWAFQIKFTAMRLWCLNGCTSPDFQIRVYNKHGQSRNDFSDGVRAIADAVENFGKREDEFRRLINRQTRPDDAEEVYKKTIAYSRKEKPWAPQFSQPKLQDLIDAYNTEASYAGDNAYAIYNGATRWATHFNTRGNRANAIVNRQSKVANMLKSKVWKDLIDA